MATPKYSNGDRVVIQNGVISEGVPSRCVGKEAIVLSITTTHHPYDYRIKCADCGNTWYVGENNITEFNPLTLPNHTTATATATAYALSQLITQGTPPAPSTVTTTETTYEIGDEVEAIKYDPQGHVGTIVRFSDHASDGKLWLGVQFTTWNEGHSLDGFLPNVSGKKNTTGYYLSQSSVIMKRKKSKAKAPAMHKLNEAKLDALVISTDVKVEITSVLKQHQNHSKLFDEWGLGDVIEYGRGMTFMFYGGPGTGKTWGAHCIAKAMGTELLVVSAAEIQSSEPGGANRAIQQAFRAAKEGKKVLFLDECDSLITNRADLGMVLASEVNTLLTEIEKFEGIAILATNRVDTMDEALERRISLIVEFPTPDLASRKKIWAKLLPKKMPLAKNVSPTTLAQHELTGGQIKNVVLQAARLALSEEAKAVGAKHFKVAIERIKKSKNLMGTASRYRQVPVDDISTHRGHGHIAIGKHRHKTTDSLSNFFKGIADEHGDN